MDESRLARKHFSRIGWFFVIAIAVIYGVQYLEKLVAEAFVPGWRDRMDVVLLLSIIPMYLFGFPVLIALMKRFVPAVKLRRYRMSPGQYLVALITCLGLAYTSNFVGTFLGFVISLVTKKPMTNAAQELTSQMSPGMILFYVVLLAPIMEEFIFRKLIVDRTVRYGQGIAILLSGLMFGLFHGNLNQFCYTVVIGFFLGFLYLKTGNIKITISLHMIFNFFGGMLPSLLLKNVDLQNFLELSAEGMSDAAILEQLNVNRGVILIMCLFGLGVLLLAVTGSILCIVFACTGKFGLKHFEGELPAGKRFSAVFCNTGMLVFIGFWLAQIVMGLFV